ncbi:MAG: ABC-2 transporter permease [Eubacteriales bacterium]|nr:ABC-2 transporter permease [Eubacteriales bacterium]
MLIYLIKKDFLIVKKYVFLMAAVAIAMPFYLLWQVPQYAGKLGFIFVIVFAVLILLQYVSVKESQYPKAAALICSAPYPRKWFALSKYGFCLIVYAGCCLIYWLESLVVPGLDGFGIEVCIGMFFAFSVFLGIYLPAQYKLGFEKTKFIFIIVIMSFPFIISLLIKMNIKINISFLNTVPPVLMYSIIMLASIMILAVSANISVKIYKKIDLV